jgi:hypothetical protein
MVAVKMKNGRRFLGLVSRDKAFHELVFTGAHHGQAAYELDQVFMLRYVDGLDGDLELNWNQVSKLEVRDILDSAGVRAMEEAFAGMRLARETHTIEPEEPAEPPVAEPAPANPEDPAAKDAKDGEKPSTEEMPLLTEFSPRAGWSPERKKQIEWRRTVVGTFPDAREQRFLDVYDQWLPLYEQWQKETAEQAEKDAAKQKEEARGAKRGDAKEPSAKEPAKDAKDPPKESPKGGEKSGEKAAPPPDSNGKQEGGHS